MRRVEGKRERDELWLSKRKVGSSGFVRLKIREKWTVEIEVGISEMMF